MNGWEQGLRMVGWLGAGVKDVWMAGWLGARIKDRVGSKVRGLLYGWEQRKRMVG